MKYVLILVLALAFTSILTPGLASVITPTEVHSHHHAPEVLNTVARQASCDSKADCADRESCINRKGICQTSACDGFCLEVIRCSCSDLCDDKSTCITIGEDDGLFLRTCISDIIINALGSFAPSPVPCDEAPNSSEEANDSEEANSSDEDDPETDGVPNQGEDDSVCIGVDLLEGFASHELVFEKHALARVVCDSSSSCATKGHMVNYRGKVMMMGTYCSIVGCEQKVMKVNSPKYVRGLKVASRAADMHFTALAARYGTKAEETVLAAVVHAGL